MMSESKNMPESLKGYFIISESEMLDPNFFQTVVLIIEHNSDGAFGLVVNRISHLVLGDILPAFAHDMGFSTPIYVGGPVQQNYLFSLHSPLVKKSTKSPYSLEIIKNEVYFEPDFKEIEPYFTPENLEIIPLDDRPQIHLFLGYSGWAPGQLESEMKQGSWIIHPASQKIVFHPNPEQGWKDALREKGGIFRVFVDSQQKPHLN